MINWEEGNKQGDNDYQSFTGDNLVPNMRNQWETFVDRETTDKCEEKR